MSDFLKHFFDERGRVNRFTEDDLNSVNNDKWDKSDFNAIISELREFADAEEQLAEFTRTGGRAMEDCFYAMMKAVPSLKESNEVRTDHLINKFVMDEAMGLSEYDELREFSVGDIVSSGLGCRDMEPELEEIFDRTKTAQKELDKLYDQMASMAEFEDQSDSLDELIQQAQEQGNQGEAKDFQKQQQQINEAMEKLRQEIQDGAGKAEQEMDDARQDVRAALRAGMEKAIESGELMEDASLMWGQERGTLHRLDPEKRIALARKLQNEKFKLVAQLIGAMIRLAFAEQRRKTLQAQNEVFDIEKGNDLSRVLPAEMIGLSDDVISLDFFSRFFDHGLLQYKMRGTERVAKGDIIVLEDGSGSMGGNREVWAKAVSIALLHVAKQQGRGFTGIHFGSSNEYKKFEWNFREGHCETDYCGQEFERLSFMDSVIHYAELFFAGGPLRLDQRVVTKEGWKPIGDVKVGDSIFTPRGDETKVLGVFPQGELELYEVKFRDGASVICDKSHIWTVKKRWTGYDDTTVAEMLDYGLKYEHASGSWYNFSVPVSKPVELNEKSYGIHPYLLGYLLGDGTLGDGRSVSIHSSEDGDFPWMQYLPEGITVSLQTEKSSERCASFGLLGEKRGKWSVNPLIDELKNLSLFGVKGEDKFVPEQYLWGSIQQRFDLLAGLLDSDGTCERNGGFSFSNTSKNLCDAVIHLSQSLGGVGSISEEKVRSNEKPRWGVRGRIDPSLGAPFKLERKLDGYVPHGNEYTRSIVSIEKVDSNEAVCIKVEADDGLFLTEGFVTTHNTDFLTPLSLALDKLNRQFEERGEVKGDIVFITDGECGVPQEWLDNFQEMKAKLGFRVWGIMIGGNERSEPFYTICDGRTYTVKDFSTGSDIRSIFGGV